VVSNYLDGKKEYSFSGIFVERQVESLSQAGVEVASFDIGNSYAFRDIFLKWRALRRMVRMFEPNVVHARYGTLVALLSVFSGPPAIITFCGSDLNPNPAVSFLRRCLGMVMSNVAALRARRVICVSEQLRRALWWRKSVALVVPDGIDLELFSPGSQKEARTQLGWHHTHPVVLFNAGADGGVKKGLDLVKAAMKVARLQVPDAKLFTVSTVKPDLMPLYYRAADALVLASRYEGSPNVVKEALACNLPVVSTPVGDVPERLVGVDPSAIVPFDHSEIGKAIAKILTLRSRSNGRGHVLDISNQRVAERIVSIYRSILGGRR
jgi:glycosyltransferase involved in cell wall biosynthesis